MTTPVCRRAFERGARQRLQHPLHQGLYKLEDVNADLKAIAEDLRVIARYKQGAARSTDIRHCTSLDLSIWLKHVPEIVARDLGYNILPAISALVADGLPQSTVTRLSAECKSLANDLVEECESVRSKIRNNISVEYELMKSGDSLNLQLILGAIDLIEIALYELRLHRGR